MRERTLHTSVRRGISVVEFAVVLPLIVLLMLGGIEAGRAMMVGHTLQEAAQAGCRVYSLRDTTQQDAQDIIDASMVDAGVTGYTILFDPLTKAEIDANMEPVSVTVSVPYDQVGWTIPWFMAGATISGSGTFPADLEDAPNPNSGYDPLDDDYVGDGNVRVGDDDD